jgi:hypothetical protein
VELNEPLMHGKERKDAAKADAEAKPTVPEPKKTEDVEKPPKKETHEPKTPSTPKKTVTPKEKPLPKERTPKTPKTPKKSNKKGDAGDNVGNVPPGNNPLDPGNNNKGNNRKKPKTVPNAGF